MASLRRKRPRRVLDTCSWCGVKALCEVDESSGCNGSDKSHLNAYCLKCWRDYEAQQQAAAAHRREQVLAFARKKRANAREDVRLARETRTCRLHPLVLMRRRLVELLFESVDGVDVDMVPEMISVRLQWPAHEVLPAELRRGRILSWSADFAMLVHRNHTNKQPSKLVLVPRIRARITSETTAIQRQQRQQQQPQMRQQHVRPGEEQQPSANHHHNDRQQEGHEQPSVTDLNAPRHHTAAAALVPNADSAPNADLMPTVDLARKGVLARAALAPAWAPVCAEVGRVLLVLDLNHVLCERVPAIHAPSEAQLASHPHTQLRPGGLVWERPYSATFLDWVLTYFAVGIWSSGKSKNIMPIANHLLTPQRRRNVVFVWGQERCTITSQPLRPCGGEDDVNDDSDDGVGTNEVAGTSETCRSGTQAGGTTGKPLIMKDLRFVWREWPCWNATNTVLIDDNAAKCSCNPPCTSVHPTKWRAMAPPPGSEEELATSGSLVRYLDELRKQPDTQAFIRAKSYSPT